MLGADLVLLPLVKLRVKGAKGRDNQGRAEIEYLLKGEIAARALNGLHGLGIPDIPIKLL